jgi:hypothetical protein
MNSAMPREPYGVTIFCDDIRQEMGGKTSLIGCYGANMVVPVPFPLVLPKLGIDVSYYLPIELPWKPIELCVFFPGDEEDKPSISAGIDEPPKRRSEEDSENNYLRLNLRTVLGPITISQAGRIRSIAVRDGQVTRLGSLRVKLSKEQAAREGHPPS